MRRKPQLDHQPFISKYCFGFAKYGICEFRVERGEGAEFAITGWLNDGHLNGVIGAGGP